MPPLSRWLGWLDKYVTHVTEPPVAPPLPGDMPPLCAETVGAMGDPRRRDEAVS